MRARVILAAIAAIACAITHAVAQPYPNRPIKLIVPFPPGGPVDVMARFVAQRLSTSIGQVYLTGTRDGKHTSETLVFLQGFCVMRRSHRSISVMCSRIRPFFGSELSSAPVFTEPAVSPPDSFSVPSTARA